MSFDDMLRQRLQSEQFPVPRDFTDRVDETLAELPSRPSRRRGYWMQTLTALAAVLALAVALPNASAAMADAMGSLPVLGPLFRAVTFRTYEVEEGSNHVSIQVPQVVDEGAESAGAEEINQQVTDYTDQLIAAYENDLHADGYFNLDVTWEVVTDTDRWFTLRLSTDLVMASGNHQERYYHIDKATGEQQTLSALFPETFDYVTVISDELKAQMRARMEADAREHYWLEDDPLGSTYFDTIDPEQDFYFDENGRIVIPFDKYEVGPGSTGSPRFTLETPEIYENLLVQP